MKLLVVKRTARGNFLLRADEDGVVVDRRVKLYDKNGKLSAFAFDTIGRVDSPFFLALPAQGIEGEFVGKWLETAPTANKK
jgi:rRNA processing protein Gar1